MEKKETSKYDVLKKTPEAIVRLTGLEIEPFEDLWAKVEPLDTAQRQMRLRRSKRRQRKAGGGRKVSLVLEDRLLLLLTYNHLYVGHVFLGNLFGIDNSNVSRHIRRLTPLVSSLYDIPKKRIRLAGAVIGPAEIAALFKKPATVPVVRKIKGSKNFDPCSTFANVPVHGSELLIRVQTVR